MASSLPGPCCYQGVKHAGVAKGSLSKIGDIEIYTVHPETPSDKGVLILTDIIGHRFINVQLIADQFAANGYTAMIPDLFHGDPVPLNRPGEFDMQAWRNGEYHPTGTAPLPENIDPIIDSCITELRTTLDCKKIGAVGYCFGAKYVVRHLQPERGEVDAGFLAHPSHVTEDELRGINGPLAIAAAETDRIFPAEKRHQSESILQETGKPYQISLFSGVAHGFAVRGDIQERAVRFAKETAFIQCLQWFGEYL
ncbi:esterase/lipase [Aspergillus ellipticus CBS 707.79]|uniref:Esterase/lipase n=1 Tax=Aspergillus ellipticus CBS 707.79 TaxID=1448320 RepID=A0A319DAH0_9EURO|nr:esterase/lipase [Aspergillus ellipticus CBS 707.79]